MNHKNKLLIVEDDFKLGNTLYEQFKEDGFLVELASDGRIAEELFSKLNPQIVILDINIPHKNGIDLCKIFKEKVPCQILMLTALGQIQDKMDAFNAGADDYLVKPFHIYELKARVNVLLKRSVESTAENEIITIADLTIDSIHKTVKRADLTIILTVKEFALLELLAKANGNIISKKDIAEKVWDINFDTGTNTIEVYISFLRNKIDKNFETKLIHTRPGFGYYLKAE